MKKFRKSELRLEKEVITALTDNELGNVKGGLEIISTVKTECLVVTNLNCIPLSRKLTECACDSRVNVCITQTEYNSCRCVDM